MTINEHSALLTGLGNTSPRNTCQESGYNSELKIYKRKKSQPCPIADLSMNVFFTCLRESVYMSNSGIQKKESFLNDKDVRQLSLTCRKMRQVLRHTPITIRTTPNHERFRLGPSVTCHLHEASEVIQKHEIKYNKYKEEQARIRAMEDSDRAFRGMIWYCLGCASGGTTGVEV